MNPLCYLYTPAQCTIGGEPGKQTPRLKEDEQARTYGNPGGATRRTRTDTRSVEGCWATITQVLHNDSAPEGLRVHPTVLLTKIAAGSYPDHSNVSIANRVSLAERRGLEPLRRCRRSRISNPAPYLLGQRSVWLSFGTSERGVEGSVWRRRCDSNTQALSGDGFLDRAATVTVYIGVWREIQGSNL